MQIVSSYGVEIKKKNIPLRSTLDIFRKAVSYLIPVYAETWEELSEIRNPQKRFNEAEHLVHETKKNHARFLFDRHFPKMPSYLRRAAIQHALGAVSSYQTRLSLWEKGELRGKPKLVCENHAMPVFYRDVMYKEAEPGEDAAHLKLFDGREWKWFQVKLLHTDMEYLRKKWSGKKASAPTLERKHHKYFLRFSYTEEVTLSKTAVKEQVICSVDLGINTDAVCSIMRADGTILGRKFINFPSDKDHLYHVLGRIRRFQREHSSRQVQSRWGYAKRLNMELSRKIATEITKYAVEYQADVIVMEHLNFQNTTDKTSKRKKKSRSMRLHLWKAQTVQDIVENKAHRLGIHIARVCAWGTSRLAFDGSGKVLRGKDSTKTNNNYSLCEFQNGKIYHCDLNASYNIGARYFIREIRKSIPVTEWQCIAAKVPECMKRSTCTLSTLRNLCSALYEPSYNGTAIA